MKKYLFYLLLMLLLLAGCGTSSTTSVLSLGGYSFQYPGSVQLQESSFSAQDVEDVIAIYEESWDTTTYKDSLIVTEKYNQGKGVIVFSKEAIDTLEVQGLTLEDKREERFVMNCKGEQKSVSLISYCISAGFVSQVPRLYMTQMFVESWEHTLVIFSHSTESKTEQQQIRQTFKTLTCN